MSETAVPSASWQDRFGESLRAAIPSLLFGARLAAGVVLALWVGFALQLDNPGWAGTSAAIVAQPVLGASLRKGIYRLIGTVIGAVATVLLTAVFPQDRWGFLLGLALWCGACSFVSTLLRNFAAYAAMLAGYTMAIIASSSLTDPNHVFELSLSRSTEICVGIVCGMLVMALTDRGRSHRKLADGLAALVADVVAGMNEQLLAGATPRPDLRHRRRALVKRAAALDPLLDQAVGESAAIGTRRRTLQAGVTGLLTALASWRTVAAQLQNLPTETARAEAEEIRRNLPEGVAQPVATALAGLDATADARLRDRWLEASDRFRHLPAETASLRLVADRMGTVLVGLAEAANACVLLGDARAALPFEAPPRWFLPDVLPPLVNGLRVFAGLAAASLVYIATSWPSGPTFITFVAVTTILLSPRDEQAFPALVGFTLGSVLTAVLAAFVKFALLPNHEGYLSFALIIAAVLVPIAALSLRPKLGPVLVPATMNFIPLLGPTNVISYNTVAYANAALAIVGGCAAGAMVLRVFPPVPPAMRTRRLLALTLRDLRGLARHHGRRMPVDRWRARIFSRLAVLPAEASADDGSSLLAALTVGAQILLMRAHLPALGLDTALLIASENAVANGAVEEACAALHALSEAVERLPDEAAQGEARLRLRAATREVRETLLLYPDFFGMRLS